MITAEEKELILGLDAALVAASCGPTCTREFNDVAGQNIQDWIAYVDMMKKFKYNEPLKLTVAEYDELAGQNKQVCYNVGTGYELMFNCFVLSICGQTQFDVVFRLFSSVYENVALAGASTDNLRLIEFLSTLDRSTDLGELVTKAVMLFQKCNFELLKNKAGYNITQIAHMVVVGAALNIAVREFKKGQYTKGTLDLVGEVVHFVPLIYFLRAFSRGDLDYNISIPWEQLTMQATCPAAYEYLKNSVVAQFLSSEYDRFVDLCKLARASARAKAFEKQQAEQFF